MTDSPDYRLDGFEPADASVERDFFSLTLSDDMFATLAAHHTADGHASYLAVYDNAAIWDVPGAPAYRSIHLQRDLDNRTFTVSHDTHPVAPLAQRWLIQRGCPAAAIELTHPGVLPPADTLTTQIEARIKTSGNRYEVVDDHTYNPGSFDVGIETWTLAYDTHPDSAIAPYRLFLEQVTPDLSSYTVREGAFADADAAQHWLDTRDTPLPEPPHPDDTAARRIRAALTRSTGLPVDPKAGLGTGATTSVSSAQRPNPGRSL
jgi:hypothetical protein